jgi:Domain of unknown function (DUF4148)
MSTRVSILAIVAAAAVCLTQAVSAQTPLSRAEVKAETRSAQKAGQLTAAGEGSPMPSPQIRSDRTRAERKAETLQARKAGELRKAGQEPEWKGARVAARTPSTTTRAERKASTLAAARSGQLTPAGEGLNSSKP